MKRNFYLFLCLCSLLSVVWACSVGDEISDILPIEACFTVSQTSCELGDCSIRFDASCSENVNQYRWDFGDGIIKEGQVVNHVYDSVGTFQVTVTFVGSGEQEKMETQIINVRPNISGHMACIAIESTSNDARIPSTVCFNASCSQNAASFEWDFDGDGLIDDTGVDACFEFMNPSTFTVKLITKDAAGNSSIDEETVTILPGKIDPSFTIENDSCSASCSITFINTSTNLTGEENYQWNFGNGNTSMASNPPSIEYTNSGDYDIRLCITRSNENPVCLDTIVTILPITTYIQNKFPPGYSTITTVKMIATNNQEHIILSEGVANDFTANSDIIITRITKDYHIEPSLSILDGDLDLEPVSILELPSNNLLILSTQKGPTPSFSRKLHIFQVDKNGNYVSDSSFGGEGSQYGNIKAINMALTEDKNEVIIMAEYLSDLIVFRLSISPVLSDNPRWGIPINIDDGNFDFKTIIRGHNDNFFALGSTNSSNVSKAIRLYEIDWPSGGLESVKEYDCSNCRAGDNGLALTSSGMAITGSKDGKVLLILTDKNGNEANRRTFNEGLSGSRGNSISTTSDGGYFIVGSQPDLDFNEGSETIILKAESDLSEAPLFYEPFDAIYWGGIAGLPTSDGGYLAVGRIGLIIAKTDDLGRVFE